MDCLVDKARRLADGEKLFEALRNKLESDDSLDTATRLSLQSEAAWVALENGNDAAALPMFEEVITAGKTTPDFLFASYQCARRLNERESLRDIILLSCADIDILDLWASNVIREERNSVSEFVAAIWMELGDKAAAIHTRLKFIDDLDIGTQKQILLASIADLDETPLTTHLELKHSIYGELIRVSKLRGEADEVSYFELKKRVHGSGELESLFNTYCLSGRVGQLEIQRELVQRASERVSELASWVAVSAEKSSIETLEFAQQVYEYCGDVESAVKVRMRSWKLQTPACIQEEAENCIQELSNKGISQSSSILIELRKILIAEAQELNDDPLELKHALRLLEEVQDDPKDVLRVYFLAAKLRDLQAQECIVANCAMFVDTFAKWVRGIDSKEETRDAIELLYLLYLEHEIHDKPIETAILLAQRLEASKARIALERCFTLIGEMQEIVPAHLHARLLFQDGIVAAALGDRTRTASSWRSAHELAPQDLPIASSLRTFCEEEQLWEEVEILRLHELSLEMKPEKKHVHFKALALLYKSKLSSPSKVIGMLEKAVSCRHDDVESLHALVDYFEANGNWSSFIERYEQLLPYIDNDQEVCHERLKNLARCYENIVRDLDKATEHYKRLLKDFPADEEVLTALRRLSEQRGDYELYVEVERATLEFIEDSKEQIRKTFELERLRQEEQNKVGDDFRVRGKKKDWRDCNLELLRVVADECAAEHKGYAVARDMYRALHDCYPFDSDILRILARLSGQLGDEDRAYGFYAGLLALFPADEEARRYVQACRAMRSKWPRCSIKEEERTFLRHGDRIEAIDGLYGPLRLQLEASENSSLERRGVSERDRLEPTGKEAQLLVQVLEPLGVENASLFHWRGGGFECDVELGGGANFLVGSNVLTGATEREQMFLVARTAELYQAGLMLCVQKSPNEVQDMLSALALVVEPGLTVSGKMDNIRKIATRIDGAFRAEIKESMRDNATRYAREVGYSDVIAWREGSLSTACRTALLLACDLTEAVETLLRLYDRDTGESAGRLRAIGELPEVSDLIRFGTSETYFSLRERLGLVLSP